MSLRLNSNVEKSSVLVGLSMVHSYFLQSSLLHPFQVSVFSF